MTPDHSPLPDDIRLIDGLHLGRPCVIATYLLLGAAPAIVDPGPSSDLAVLEAGLAANGLAFADLHAILLTHIHLDHAGATGTIVARYPHLRVYVHQRGAPHMIAPERLLRSATRLYGADMDRLWGEFRAVPADRVTVLGGGETIQLGERRLRVLDAPGHASHHLIYFDEPTGAAFVGDAGGVRMPGCDYVRPPTPPPDIDIEAWLHTLAGLRALEPSLLLPTHFGPAPNPEAHIASFAERLQTWAALVRTWLARGDDEATQLAALQAVADADLDGADSTTRAQYQQATPLEQSWHGLVRYWRKRDEREQG